VRPLALAALAAACAALAPSTVNAQPPPERGIALGLFAEDPSFSYAGMLDEIARAGASHVSLVMPFYQHNVRSVRVGRHPRFSPSPALVLRVMKQARARGLKVLLFPILRLEYTLTPDEWRGSIRPKDPDLWWRSYGQAMLEAAALAHKGKADSLCVGSELGSMDGAPGPWEALIRKVRKVFRGPLIYSANWDRFRHVGIWHLVDRMGISAYFQLTAPDEEPSLERLIHAWREVRADVSRARARAGKPLVFTEVGYHSQKGTAARPWDEAADLPLGLEVQARCYRAFVRVWGGVSYLRGAYIWNWFGYGGPSSREYTPRGKPAARVICGWYGAAAGQCPTRFGLR